MKQKYETKKKRTHQAVRAPYSSQPAIKQRLLQLSRPA
jgi:hypothetical protein